MTKSKQQFNEWKIYWQQKITNHRQLSTIRSALFADRFKWLRLAPVKLAMLAGMPEAVAKRG